MDKFILKNIAGCYQNRNPSQTFLWGLFHLQKFQNFFPVGVTFFITQDYNLQLRTLLNSVTKCFEIAEPTTMENYQKNVCSGVRF